MVLLQRASWKGPKKGQSFYEKREIDKIALMHDPYAVAWKQPQGR